MVFEDFAYQLYSSAQRARHDAGELDKLTPYFSEAAHEKLAGRARRVDQVVIGSLGIRSVLADRGEQVQRHRCRDRSEPRKRRRHTNIKERWTFLRDIGVKTRPPEHTRALACPNCNAPFMRSTDPRTCSHCGERVSVGRFDWTVAAINVDAETSVGSTLTGTVAEVGNNWSTIIDADAQDNEMAVRRDDPSVTIKAFCLRAEMIYKRLNEAWNAQNLTPVRGLVTASLLQYLQFWINEYQRQHLANHLDEPKVDRVSLAKVVRDRWYDAMTVRIYAAGFDYTTDQDGKVVGGSRTDRRAYTEYWTFIRSSARRGPVTVEPNCPNCGAPLAISDAGACTSCNAEIENASFDWTLSKIEQDDVYRG